MAESRPFDTATHRHRHRHTCAHTHAHTQAHTHTQSETDCDTQQRRKNGGRKAECLTVRRPQSAFQKSGSHTTKRRLRQLQTPRWLSPSQKPGPMRPTGRQVTGGIVLRTATSSAQCQNHAKAGRCGQPEMPPFEVKWSAHSLTLPGGFSGTSTD